MSETEQGIAQKTQEKFEFYIISLVFTLLALSIQTAKFGNSDMTDMMELTGWFSLLVSGIAGLWRMEFIPVQRLKQGRLNDLENKVSELKEHQLKGVSTVYNLHADTTESLEQLKKKYQDGITVLEPLIKKLDRRNMIKYYVHRYFFVVGVILLVFARGFIGAKGLF